MQTITTIGLDIACPSSNALRQFATLLSGGSSSSVRLS